MSDSNKATEILLAAKRAGRLHHAILLYGTSLGELEKTAKTVANTLLGSFNGKHPDLFELRPEGKARFIKVGAEADKSGGELPKNSMRGLLHQLRQTSSLGGEKVAVIYEADRMNNVAANAFLKTLEEPPSATTIFMLTTRPNDLLDTIRSRCIALRVESAPEPLDDDEWKIWLGQFKEWQKSIMKNSPSRTFLGDAIMRAYALLSRFDEILSRLTDDKANLDEGSHEELDEEVIDAIIAGERRALRKKMLGDIEEACVECAPASGAIQAVKLARAVSELEKASVLMELNMADTPALEQFMLNSLRIWMKQ